MLDNIFKLYKSSDFKFFNLNFNFFIRINYKKRGGGFILLKK